MHRAHVYGEPAAFASPPALVFSRAEVGGPPSPPLVGGKGTCGPTREADVSGSRWNVPESVGDAICLLLSLDFGLSVVLLTRYGTPPKRCYYCSCRPEEGGEAQRGFLTGVDSLPRLPGPRASVCRSMTEMQEGRRPFCPREGHGHRRRHSTLRLTGDTSPKLGQGRPRCQGQRPPLHSSPASAMMSRLRSEPGLFRPTSDLSCSLCSDLVHQGGNDRRLTCSRGKKISPRRVPGVPGVSCFVPRCFGAGRDGSLLVSSYK